MNAALHDFRSSIQRTEPSPESPCIDADSYPDAPRLALSHHDTTKLTSSPSLPPISMLCYQISTSCDSNPIPKHYVLVYHRANLYILAPLGPSSTTVVAARRAVGVCVAVRVGFRWGDVPGEVRSGGGAAGWAFGTLRLERVGA
jgi:hypothetical protein